MRRLATAIVRICNAGLRHPSLRRVVINTDGCALRTRCAPYAADGHIELYKSTLRFDGAVGREQHGYPPKDKMPL